jgi:hypothetical protein
MAPVASRNYFHCDHCNNFEFPEETGDGVCPAGDPAHVNCPVCAKEMQFATIEDKCRGFLTPMRTFGMIVTKRRAFHGPNEEQFNPIDPAEIKRVLKCPSCQRRMDAHPYAGGGNAVVDTCETCSIIWLDAGELAIIERHIPHESPRVPPPPATGFGSADDEPPFLSSNFIPNDLLYP